jgi:hypothetical protein
MEVLLLLLLLLLLHTGRSCQKGIPPPVYS